MVSSANELKQLTVNMIVNLQLEATVEMIEEAVQGAGSMEESAWTIDQFKEWFFRTFNFSSKDHLDELTKATHSISAELEKTQNLMLECDDEAQRVEYEKEMATMEKNQTQLATKVREFNKMEAEQKAKADAALEKKKLAESARARKKAREETARGASIAQNTAACNAVAKQIEETQNALLDNEDEDEEDRLEAKLEKLTIEQSELSVKVRALNASLDANPVSPAP